MARRQQILHDSGDDTIRRKSRSIGRHPTGITSGPTLHTGFLPTAGHCAYSAQASVQNKANSTMNLIQHIATPVRNRLARIRPRTQHAKQSQFQSGQSCLIENLVAPYRGRKSRWPITQNKANLPREKITISVPSTKVYRLLPSAGRKENKANDKLGNIQCPSTHLPIHSPSVGLWPGELSLDAAVGFIYATDRFSRPQVWQGGILEA